MAIGKEILAKQIYEVFITGKAILIAEDRPNYLQSLIVRLHRLRNEMKKNLPALEENVEIAKDSKGVILRKPSIARNMILRENEDGEFVPVTEEEIYPNKRTYEETKEERIKILQEKDKVYKLELAKEAPINGVSPIYIPRVYTEEEIKEMELEKKIKGFKMADMKDKDIIKQFPRKESAKIKAILNKPPPQTEEQIQAGLIEKYRNDLIEQGRTEEVIEAKVEAYRKQLSLTI